MAPRRRPPRLARRRGALRRRLRVLGARPPRLPRAGAAVPGQRVRRALPDPERRPPHIVPRLPMDQAQGNQARAKDRRWQGVGRRGGRRRGVPHGARADSNVYQQSIGAVCNLDWPRSNFLVQVLDDSDDAATSALIKEEVEKWQQEGVRILYRCRVIRDGYKAGNLKSAMNYSYVKDYEFVVIFDADFQPQADFLKRAVPHFKGNEDVGLVQARWSFVNKDENLLTRLQNINLCFHFEVEQQVNGVFLNFFGFNGTAGVWRIKALEDSGGWMERTTVEDMDIAVRAHLKGWKFLFLNDVECQCECRSHMKHTESSSIDGIPVPCSCLDSASWTLSNQRETIIKTKAMRLGKGEECVSTGSTLLKPCN